MNFRTNWEFSWHTIDLLYSAAFLKTERIFPLVKKNKMYLEKSE